MKIRSLEELQNELTCFACGTAHKGEVGWQFKDGELVCPECWDRVKHLERPKTKEPPKKRGRRTM